MRSKFFNFSLLLMVSTITSADMGMTGMISNQITRTVNDGIAKNLFDNLIIPQLKIKNSSGRLMKLDLSSDERFLTLLLEDGSARVWDLDVGVQRPMIRLESGSISSIASSNNQGVLYVANKNTIDRYDFYTAKKIDRLAIRSQDIKDINISPDDSTLIVNAGSHTLTAWDIESQQQKWNKAIADGDIQYMDINRENQVVAVSIRKPSLFSVSDLLQIRDLSDGSIIKELDNSGNQIRSIQFSEPKVVEAIYENGEIISWNISTGEAISSKNIDHDILAVSKLANGMAAYVIDKDTILIVNQQGNTLSRISKEDIGVTSVKLLANGGKLMTADTQGKTLLWDANTGSEILQIISTKQGWSVVDKLGRFDSSEKGMPNISWEAKDRDIPLDNFSKKYYEPGLLATALKDGHYINQKPAAVPKGISLPPELEIVVKAVKTTNNMTELKVDVYGQGGGIDNVALYHNTKVVAGQKAIIDEQSFVKDNREHKSLKMQLVPVNGMNSIKVVASNKMGIEGESEEVQFAVNKEDAKPIMRVITIGVNQYKDSQLNLDFSVPDAQTIANLLNTTDVSKFSNIERRQLYNASATKLSIMSELVNLSNGKANDVLAIYFAGHGISVNGEWYFLPHETTLQPDINYFTRVGISASELSSIFVDSNIQQILLMVDACYSGASVDSFRRLQNSQRHFSRDISKSVGITVVTATRKDQQAAELSELGHGLFTYVLSRGMNGEADWWPQNNEISAHELAKFSTDTIPLFSKKFLGAAQEPTAFTMGKDFSILAVKK